MTPTQSDADPVIRAVMDEWQSAIDAHDASRVAAVFTEDAVFQGLRPYGVGRDAVAAYYESQPAGMAVTYRILETRSPSADVVLGYLVATFTYPDRPSAELAIGVVLTRDSRRWQVAQYQASRL
ncbi:SgcJ/EcaC family oxidoreductase [Mycobacterium sp. CPCC 205372]|uniref:SgcJ/EcaC family oxidoreductase n=1 Tax=Mycobacterium hippophais TaxID=3016340 RepID=A0ABT4PUF2_9MYCO|nr:SgcJ/EcaC family oxidoreductase [Mycobacterium hippophais]MCZ8380178.1 SgcJ/EcaC family oxidoreductase [Mycobacterium hippophais]